MSSGIQNLQNDLRAEIEKETIDLLSLSKRRTKHDYRRLAHLANYVAGYGRTTERRWQDADTAELEAILAEYTSLRQESMNTINNRIQVLMLGIAAIGALGAGALAINNPTLNKPLVYSIFSAAIPLIAVFILVVWVSEAVRSHRVGYFLAADCEAKINAKLERFAMSWESSLWAGRLPRDGLLGPSMMAMAIIGIIAAGAPFFGILLTQTQFSGSVLFWLPIILPYALYFGTGSYVWWRLPKLKNKDVIVSTLYDPNLNMKE